MIDEIVRSNSLTIDGLRRLVADVPDELMTRQVAGAVNHPAWVIGHLTHSCEAIGGEMGLSEWLPSDWKQAFGTGSSPVDEREHYPSKAELLTALTDGQRRIVERLTLLGESGLTAPLPDVRYRQTYPTLGHAVLHVLTAHAALHVGQIAVWRRAVGLSALNEPLA